MSRVHAGGIFLVALGCGGTDPPPGPPDCMIDCDEDASPPCSDDLDCGDSNLCTEDRCDDGVCRNDPYPPGEPDRDRDGHGDAACGGDDCDDADPDVPLLGDAELCNGKDDNCNGTVDEGGLLVHGEDVLISADLASNVTLAAAHAGEGYGALWAREETWDLWFQLLDADGEPLGDPASIAGAFTPSRPGHVALVGIPEGFFAAWGQEGEVHYSIIDAASEPGLPGAIQVEGQTDVFHVDAAYSGSVVALVWVGVVGSFAYPTWTVVSPDGSEVSPPEPAEEPTTPLTVAVEWIGDRFAFLYEGLAPAVGLPDGGKMLTIDEAGTPEGPGHFTSTEIASQVLAWDGSAAYLVWTNRKAIQIEYRMVDETAAPITAEAVIASDTFGADVADRGSGTLVAWLEGWDGLSYLGTLHAAVLGPDVVDTPIQPVDDTENRARVPSLVADEGGGFAIAFALESGGVFFDRIGCE